MPKLLSSPSAHLLIFQYVAKQHTSNVKIFFQYRYEEEAILIAKENGADSITVLHGKNLFGLALEENVSVLHFILSRQNAIKIMGALDERYDFSNPETNSGIAFTQALTSVVGEYTQALE